MTSEEIKALKERVFEKIKCEDQLSQTVLRLEGEIGDRDRQIESLQSEIIGLKDISGRYEQLQDKHRKLMEESDSLESQLAESQRREQEAVEDLQKIDGFNGSTYCRCNEMLKIAMKWRGEKGAKK